MKNPVPLTVGVSDEAEFSELDPLRGLNSRASFCPSAICSGVIVSATSIYALHLHCLAPLQATTICSLLLHLSLPPRHKAKNT